MTSGAEKFRVWELFGPRNGVGRAAQFIVIRARGARKKKENAAYPAARGEDKDSWEIAPLAPQRTMPYRLTSAHFLEQE